MNLHTKLINILIVFFAISFLFIPFLSAENIRPEGIQFPHSLDSYDDTDVTGFTGILISRARQEPFNLVATLIFFSAVLHTFFSSRFLSISHRWRDEHEIKKKEGKVDRDSVHIGAGIMSFFGEVEAIFGIWAIALAVSIVLFFDWSTFQYYIIHKLNFTEPMFVVVIMTLAATRPILKLTELFISRIVNIFGDLLIVWWFVILTIGPLLGSLITGPAAITISALLLSNKYYRLQPSESFKYATIGLLFVNISVGGTLTNFATPPVLMVAGTWNWDISFMFSNFGWKAVLGIIVANSTYLVFYRKELMELEKKYAVVRLKKEIQAKYIKSRDIEEEINRECSAINNEMHVLSAIDKKTEEIKTVLKKEIITNVTEKAFNLSLIEEALENKLDEIKLREIRKTLPGLLPDKHRPPLHDPDWDNREGDVPFWAMLVHLFFIVWTVVNSQVPVLFIAGLLFYLGFARITYFYQNRTDLKPSIMVGFFLASLVIHGGLQGWWIAPVLSAFSQVPLMAVTAVLTSFNDNAAITYLSTIVPGLAPELKYAVVAGAVAGGGLTVIANAPNPAGQSILKKHFRHGVSPVRLLKGAIIPTLIMWLFFLL